MQMYSPCTYMTSPVSWADPVGAMNKYKKILAPFVNVPLLSDPRAASVASDLAAECGPLLQPELQRLQPALQLPYGCPAGRHRLRTEPIQRPLGPLQLPGQVGRVLPGGGARVRDPVRGRIFTVECKLSSGVVARRRRLTSKCDCSDQGIVGTRVS